MRFLELGSGDLLNVDDIKLVGFERVKGKKDDTLFSYVFDKNGKKYDFLEIPSIYEKEGVENIFDTDEIITYQRIATQLILSSPDNQVIRLQKLEDDAWQLFMLELNTMKF